MNKAIAALGIPFGKTMSDEALAILRSHGTPRKYNKGQFAVSVGDALNHVLMIEEGSFSFSITEEDGTKSNYGYVGAGTVWGIGIVLREDSASLDFEAVEDSVLNLISRETLWHLIDNDPIVRRDVIIQLSWMIRKAAEFGHEERTNPLRRRLVKFLIRNATQSGTIDLSQEELAQNLGVSRYALGKHLHLLKELSLIDVEYKRITLKDEHGLMKFATPLTDG